MQVEMRRVRFTLLVLLWIWAICVFTVVDLFWNVSEFDGVRPRAAIYEGMRRAAHKMVGEPYQDDGNDHILLARVTRRQDADSPDPTLRMAQEQRVRAVGGRPPAPDSEAGRRLVAGLEKTAKTSDEPQRRIAAVRSLARMYGAQAHATLLAVVRDASQPDDVGAAARESLDKLSSREGGSGDDE